MNYEHLSEVYDDYLEHYGVKGMEWGKKKKIKDTRTSTFSGLTQPFVSRVKKATAYDVSKAASGMVRGASRAAAASAAPKVQAKSDALLANRERREEVQKGAVGAAASTVAPRVKSKVNTLAANNARKKGVQKGAASGVSKAAAGKYSEVLTESIRKAQMKLKTRGSQKGTVSGFSSQTAKNLTKVLNFSKKAKINSVSSKTTSKGKTVISKMFSKKKS